MQSIGSDHKSNFIKLMTCPDKNVLKAMATFVQ